MSPCVTQQTLHLSCNFRKPSLSFSSISTPCELFWPGKVIQTSYFLPVVSCPGSLQNIPLCQLLCYLLAISQVYSPAASSHRDNSLGLSHTVLQLGFGISIHNLIQDKHGLSKSCQLQNRYFINKYFQMIYVLNNTSYTKKVLGN